MTGLATSPSKDQSKQLIRFAVPPVLVGAGQCRDRLRSIHRVEESRHTNHVGQPSYKAGLAQSGQADQQHRPHAQRRLYELADRTAPVHAVDDRCKVRHVVAQLVESGTPPAVQSHGTPAAALCESDRELLDYGQRIPNPDSSAGRGRR